MGTAPKPGRDKAQEGHTATEAGAKGENISGNRNTLFWPGHNSLHLPQKYTKRMQALLGALTAPPGLAGLATDLILQQALWGLPYNSLPSWTSLGTPTVPPSLSAQPCSLPRRDQGCALPVPSKASITLRAGSTRQVSQGDGLIFKSQFKAAQKRLCLKGIAGRVNLHAGSEMQNLISHPLTMETSTWKKASQAGKKRQCRRPPADAWPPMPITASSPARSPTHKYTARHGAALTPTHSGGAV